MDYICIGKIVNTHGVKGELKIQSYSDHDSERYQKGNTVYVAYEEEYLPFHVASFRVHKGFPLVSFEDHQNINDVEKYKNSLVYIRAEDRKPLPEGEYYRSDLIGLSCLDEENILIGKCIAVEETNGAQNNLRIKTEDGKEILVPNVPLFVKKIDLSEEKIIIHVVEGLL